MATPLSIGRRLPNYTTVSKLLTPMKTLQGLWRKSTDLREFLKT
jgi:hypothetical protein